jgi:hypothetical protein
MTGPPRRLGGGDVTAIEVESPVRRCTMAADHIEQRRLAGTIRTDDTTELSGVEMEVEVADCVDSAVADGQPVALDDGPGDGGDGNNDRVHAGPTCR